MPEPKYLDSLRGEIAELDRKIDDFHGKFDQKVDLLSESLHRFDLTLTVLNTKFETFAEHVVELTDQLKPIKEAGTEFKGFKERVDKFIDRTWGLFVTGLLLLLGSMATLGASIWQVHQHGNQIEKLEASMARLDQSVSSLEKSLGAHGDRLEKLEEGMGKIARLEDKLSDLPRLVGAIDDLVRERRQEIRQANEPLHLFFPLNAASRVGGGLNELAFGWDITEEQANVMSGHPSASVRFVGKGVGNADNLNRSIKIGDHVDLLLHPVMPDGPNSSLEAIFRKLRGMKIDVKGKRVRMVLEFTEAPQPDAIEVLLGQGLVVELLVFKH